MIIKRDRYLQKFIDKKQDGMIKIVTCIRRCGKSFLLETLFRNYLVESGVPDEHIIMIALDEKAFTRYRNPDELDNFVREKCSDKSAQYYVLIDEIQMVESIHNPFLPDNPNEKIGFVEVLLGLMKLHNVDLYVTGSNSRMLSTDVMTEFKDRGEEIHMNPLTFDEFHSVY